MKSLVQIHQKKSQLLIMFLSVTSISSTMQEILLQMSTEMKMEGRKSFT